MRKSFYMAYVGNVTLRDKSGAWTRDRVIWAKGDKLTEAKVAKMLNKAYDLGRKEVMGDMVEAMASFK